MRTIKSAAEFSKVFSKGYRAGSRLIRITYLKHEGEGKLAFVAAKRLGNAVYRNRCKRLLREAARLNALPSNTHHIILFATKHTHDAHPQDIARELMELLGSHGIT